MKIKGYTPADEEIGQETGVEVEYFTEFGRVFVRIKHTGSDNVSFTKAADKHVRRESVREKTGFKLPKTEAQAETAALYFDHAIISWRTDVVDEDVDGSNPIEPTRANFIELMSLEYFDVVLAELIKDCHDRKMFIKGAEADIVKK